jgi:uncharacterized protein
VPFIARYRKERTGELDEVAIRNIEERLGYYTELEERKVTVLKSIEEQGKLTPELRTRIEATRQKTELEDLYLPYKPKRRTKGDHRSRTRAGAWRYHRRPGVTDGRLRRPSFVDAEREVPDAAAALEGPDISLPKGLPKKRTCALRPSAHRQGLFLPVAADKKEAPQVQMYYDFRNLQRGMVAGCLPAARGKGGGAVPDHRCPGRRDPRRAEGSDHNRKRSSDRCSRLVSRIPTRFMAPSIEVELRLEAQAAPKKPSSILPTTRETCCWRPRREASGSRVIDQAADRLQDGGSG